MTRLISSLPLAFMAALAVESVTLVPTSAFAQAPSAAEAKTHLTAGTKATQAKDWSKALAEFEAANKAQPSADALEGVANAQYQLKQEVEAHASYDEYLKKYGASAPKAKRTLAETRLKELGERTGTITVSSSETGAQIAIDDKPVGTAPLAAPIRVTVGPHRVRITKDGFAPVDQAPSVTANATITVTAKLEAVSSKGRLSVREKNGKPIRILVDGVDMGEAPWSGEVEAGLHAIEGRSPQMAAAPEKVEVERGKTRDVELTASSTTATLKVATSDGKGIIYLDGKLVGEGTFLADIPSGPHAIRITREGYDTYEEPIDLKDKENKAVSVTMKLNSKIETGPVVKEARRVEGIYGGVGLLGSVLIGGMKSSMQKTCEASDRPVELASCSGEGGGSGAGLAGFFGYHWDPVGVELYAGAQYDSSAPTLTWNASSVDPGIGPDPARTEEFAVRRVGGFAIARVRLTVQGETIRFSVAGGVGLSYRAMFLDRDTTLAANSQVRDVFVPDAQSYVSPVVSLEPTIQWRFTPTTALAVGAALLVESPRAFDAIPTTPEDGSRRLGQSGLTTPQYELATGTQIYIGPFIGVMFGP